MATLTSTSTFIVGDAAVAVETVTLPVILPAAAGSGAGRLVHPSLGTLDYERPPDECDGMRGDAIIAPIWSSTKTLLGASNTLFLGDLRDVQPEERWTQSLVGSSAFVDSMISFWMNPPDPSVAYVQWFPSYLNGLGFNVVMLDLSLGRGKGITATPLMWGSYSPGIDRGPMTLRMRIISRL